jgi:putative glycosyltransferase (TIGR04348 family)
MPFGYNPHMQIVLVCPAPVGSLKGNRVTAVRWARLLGSLGHEVHIERTYQDQPCDVLIALHARKSYPAVRRFRRLFKDKPIIVLLTGTDLYHDFKRSKRARASVAMANRLAVLQRLAVRQLPIPMRGKVRVVIQSAEPSPQAMKVGSGVFQVCILGHLRHEKDPFRGALATRCLPSESRVRMVHLGKALSPAMAKRARQIEVRSPRYRWLGELDAKEARAVLAGSHLLLLSSKMEGGANVISEALADGVPVLASRIPGSVGILGGRYPGYFSVGNTKALTRLLWRAENDTSFYGRLVRWCHRLRPLVRPARERAALRSLMKECRTMGLPLK